MTVNSIGLTVHEKTDMFLIPAGVQPDMTVSSIDLTVYEKNVINDIVLKLGVDTLGPIVYTCDKSPAHQ